MASASSIQIEIDGVLVQNLKELAELVALYSSTNEAQRKRIDELLEGIAKANRRAEAAEQRIVDLMAERDVWHYKHNDLVARLDRVQINANGERNQLEQLLRVLAEKVSRLQSAELAPSLNSRQPKPGYVWAIMWYPGWRKELVEVLPEQVDSLDTALHRLANNRKAYVALANVVAVARQGW